MPTLTEATSSELVVPIPPSTVHRTIDRLSDEAWVVTGWSAQFSSAFAALLAIREDVEREARHPTRIAIRWRGVTASFTPPSTGASL